VNSGGPVMNNIGYDVPYDQTSAFVAKHRFVISMENTIHPGYVTEKILHGFRNDVVPIYCGAPDVDELFDERTFLRYDGDNFDEVVQRLLSLEADADAYLGMLAAPKLPVQRRPEFREGALEARIAAVADVLLGRTRSGSGA
jgi:alpha(1,3/1,4) fucosyltransferase